MATLDGRKIRMVVSDSGSGIPDIDQAMTPGFSTASEWVRELGFGAGMGLANIQNCAESFQICSTVGKGTALYITVPLEAE